MVIDRFPYILGRHEALPFSLDDSSISSKHAVLELSEDQTKLMLRDLGSRNGLRFVGGEKIAVVALEPGTHLIQLGRLEFTFSVSDAAGQFGVNEGTQIFSEQELREGAGFSSRSRRGKTRSGVRVRPLKAGAKGKADLGPLMKFREPTGGIRLAQPHSQPRSSSSDLGSGSMLPGSERRGSLGEGANTHSARRIGDTSILRWGVGLTLFLGPVWVFYTVRDLAIPGLSGSNLSIGWGLAFSAVFISVAVLVVSLFYVSIRFLFKRGDIDYLTLFKQVTGAHLLMMGFAMGLSLFEQEGPLSHWRMARALGYLFQYLSLFFTFYALVLLRARDQRPGSFVRFFPVTAALGLVVLKGMIGAQEKNGLDRNLLVSAPRVPPFSELDPSREVASKGSTAEGEAESGTPAVGPVMSELRSALEELDQRHQAQERTPASGANSL